MSNALLTAQEIRELKIMCANPFLELGMTLRPKHLKCINPHVVTNTMKTIILFKEHEDAEKWNIMHQTRIRKGGHLATITLAALVGLLTTNYPTSVATAATVGIIKDEVQANIWYPKMFKGWMLTRQFTFRYEQFPGQHFYMAWTDDDPACYSAGGRHNH